MATNSFKVLLVCTANHCRSPIAEHLLKERVEAIGLPWSVSSAGTRAARGLPMHPQAERLLGRRGHDVSRWRSRSAAYVPLEDYDLMLTATEAHRGVLSQLAPAKIPAIFTLFQFAHLLPGPQPAAVTLDLLGTTLLDHAVAGRTRVQPMPKQDRDLADPMGHGKRRFQQCAVEIDRALDAVLSSVLTVG